MISKEILTNKLIFHYLIQIHKGPIYLFLIRIHNIHLYYYLPFLLLLQLIIIINRIIQLIIHFILLLHHIILIQQIQVKINYSIHIHILILHSFLQFLIHLLLNLIQFNLLQQDRHLIHSFQNNCLIIRILYEYNCNKYILHKLYVRTLYYKHVEKIKKKTKICYFNKNCQFVSFLKIIVVTVLPSEPPNDNYL